MYLKTHILKSTKFAKVEMDEEFTTLVIISMGNLIDGFRKN